MRMNRALVIALPLLPLGLAAVPVAAQAPTMIKGEAILAHPAGKLALRAAELLAAGKIEDVIRLRTAADQAEWKKQPAAEREDSARRMKDRAADPKRLAEEIRKGGVLTVFKDRAMLPEAFVQLGQTRDRPEDEAGGVLLDVGRRAHVLVRAREHLLGLGPGDVPLVEELKCQLPGPTPPAAHGDP